MNHGILQGAVRPEPPAVQPPLALPSRTPLVSVLGDSITSDGVTKTTTGSCAYGEKSWIMWGSGLSGGKYLVGHVGGAGGITSGRLRTDFLRTFLAEQTIVKSGYCVVLIGTNDAGNSVPFDTTKANLIAIWSDLIAAGIEPIACTLTPRSGSLAYQQINTFIRYYTFTRGIKLLDFAADPTLAHNNNGAWITGLSDDGIHPNATGAKAMGQILADRFKEWGMLTTGPWLSPAQSDGMNAITATNSLMMTDTNADGVPDNWALTGAGATCALAAATTGLGNKATVTAAAAATTLLSTAVTGQQVQYLVAGMRCQSTVAGTTPSVTFQALGASTNFISFTSSIDVPAGFVLTGLIYLKTSLSLVAGVSITPGTGTVAVINQPTIYEITKRNIL